MDGKNLQVTLNKEQAQIIAAEIFEDIDRYIAEHQDEFEAFLREEEESFAEVG